MAVHPTRSVCSGGESGLGGVVITTPQAGSKPKEASAEQEEGGGLRYGSPSPRCPGIASHGCLNQRSREIGVLRKARIAAVKYVGLVVANYEAGVAITGFAYKYRPIRNIAGGVRRDNELTN